MNEEPEDGEINDPEDEDFMPSLVRWRQLHPPEKKKKKRYNRFHDEDPE